MAGGGETNNIVFHVHSFLFLEGTGQQVVSLIYSNLE